MNAQSEWFSLQQVTPHIFAVAEPHHWEEVISYVFVTPDQLFLFDTGMGYESLSQFLQEQFYSRPVTVLLSHAHWDHIGSVHEFTDIWIHAHTWETERLARGFHSLEVEELSSPYFSAPFVTKEFIAPGSSQFQTFQDGYTFETSCGVIAVIHTPGHTPGSVCFWLPEENVLITGDTLYPAAEFLYLPESNVVAYTKSIKKLLHQFRDSTITILPGHNAIQTNIQLLQDHHDALLGKTKAHKRELKEDHYGKFEECFFQGFSLRLPQC